MKTVKQPVYFSEVVRKIFPIYI